MKKLVSIILIITLCTSFFSGCDDNKNIDVTDDITPSMTVAQNELSLKEDAEDENPDETLVSTDEPTGTENPCLTEKTTLTETAKPVNPNKLENCEIPGEDISSAINFAVNLFKLSDGENKDEMNKLVSPVSVLIAIAMIANGAEGETLQQIEQAFGMSIKELNSFIYSYVNSLPEGEKYKPNLANSIWINEYKNFTIDANFEEDNKAYYDAGIFNEAFNKDTEKKINEWVNNHTDGMIPKIMENINEDNVIYLLNALAFEAEWEEPYGSVSNGIFTCEDGTEVGAEFLYGNESRYIEDSMVTGFAKYYKDESYAFIALLPNEGVTVSQYIQSLSADRIEYIIWSALYEQIHKEVDTVMPKFTIDYSAELSSILQQMGIQNAFDPGKADFSGVGNSSSRDLYINQAIHKTHIEVNERGTRAGAVTEMDLPESAPMDPKEVRLNRPFVYMIIDCENNLPIFMGTVRDLL